MALPPIAKATLQAALINAGSNILAQSIQSYRDEKPFELDLQTLFQFTTCAFVMSPMTFLWLEGLESALPGHTSEEPAATKSKAKKADRPKQKKLNVKNTVAKVVIDQVVGGAWATVLFSLTMGLLRGQEYDVLVDQIRKVRISDITHGLDFWPLLIAGFKLWPLVSILNFTVVPVDKRLLVGSIFGVVWAVYLSLMSG
ncbi:Mpv17 / PMP22 family protein [Aspergillus parasiticus SU-1]|uniref:Mpv17 / PMP22 family protein n=1 Tax=Aspergillus parasiticus (strain ATCC 56775 / NRRL 5862 / SRRC 143 / SU-1) TaxID=1403190 RepID=A0A0F0I9D6_ASPPU|nr:Mpv17 / PMP22 family protein [Aspergillus parasiticus SU-1]